MIRIEGLQGGLLLTEEGLRACACPCLLCTSLPMLSTVFLLCAWCNSWPAFCLLVLVTTSDCASLPAFKNESHLRKSALCVPLSIWNIKEAMPHL